MNWPSNGVAFYFLSSKLAKVRGIVSNRRLCLVYADPRLTLIHLTKPLPHLPLL
jgi:hypothetical protein